MFVFILRYSNKYRIVDSICRFGFKPIGKIAPKLELSALGCLHTTIPCRSYREQYWALNNWLALHIIVDCPIRDR